MAQTLHTLESIPTVATEAVEEPDEQPVHQALVPLALPLLE